MKTSAACFSVLTLLVATLAFAVGSPPRSLRASSDGAVPQPAVTDFQFIKGGTTPPTEADCEAVGRTCFTPQAIQSAYDIGPLYAKGLNGKGRTIAVVDWYGRDTMAPALHVFNQAFGLAPMCGEEGVTCAAGMPTFSELAINGTPATKPQPGNGTHLEDKSAWALEVALDVETAHAIAPGASILLVHTNNAETLGVQGFPQMMKAEDFVVTNRLADVISQSFGSAEEAFSSFPSLENLRFAYKNAAANGVTVLASSGDGGTANGTKQPTAKGGNLIPFPTVPWPASDPLVTSVGGTYLCTDPTATTNQPRTKYVKTGIGGKCGNPQFNPGAVYDEVAWTFSGGGFSHVFARESWQNSLPAGSTAIGTMRGVPDVAVQASAGTGALVYVSLPPDGPGRHVRNTGWDDIGGTSLSCPQWAGLVALAPELNGGSLGPINAALYKIGADATRYANDFFDIPTGNPYHGAPSVPGYPATKGWDPVTGLGTPNAANLVPDLVKALHGN